ncbi:MAG: hypothetical protein ACKVX7_11680, partial [Planctomycetota bacterium]
MLVESRRARFIITVVAFVLVGVASVTGQTVPSKSLDYLGASSGSTSFGPTPFGPTLGPVHQGPVLHAGVSPLGVCYNAAGAVFGVPTLY